MKGLVRALLWCILLMAGAAQAIEVGGLKFDDTVKVFNIADYSVNLEDGKDSVFKNRSGFRIPIAKGLNFSTQLEFEYDNLPALNQKKTDSSLLFSVGLGF